MNDINFCHWLKGTFDLLNIKSFNEHQTNVIKLHLALVLNENPPGETPFCNWLNGYFEISDMSGKTINKEVAIKIQKHLNETVEKIMNKDYHPMEEYYDRTNEQNYEAKC